MKKYLVIGIDIEDGISTFSAEMESELKPGEVLRNGQIFADFLYGEVGDENDFQSILVVHDNEVVADMNQGEHYDIEG